MVRERGKVMFKYARMQARRRFLPEDDSVYVVGLQTRSRCSLKKSENLLILVRTIRHALISLPHQSKIITTTHCAAEAGKSPFSNQQYWSDALVLQSEGPNPLRGIKYQVV